MWILIYAHFYIVCKYRLFCSFLKNLFILFLAALGLCCCVQAFLQLWRAGATLRCGVWASHCGGFSCCGARALGAQASVVAACGLSGCGSRVLEHRLTGCDTRAQLLRSMWDLPGLGLEHVSPELAGEFSTTTPPGEPCFAFSFLIFISLIALAQLIASKILNTSGGSRYPCLSPVLRGKCSVMQN